MSSKRPSSPGHLGGPAAQAIVEQKRLANAMAEVRKILNSRPAPGMGLSEQSAYRPPVFGMGQPSAQQVADPTGMRAQIINGTGGRRRKSHRKSRKNRKSRKSRH